LNFSGKGFAISFAFSPATPPTQDLPSEFQEQAFHRRK